MAQWNNEQAPFLISVPWKLTKIIKVQQIVREAKSELVSVLNVICLVLSNHKVNSHIKKVDERVSETFKQEVMLVLIFLINEGKSTVRVKNVEMLNT